MLQIPKRFQYEWFARYAPTLGKALSAYPSPLKVVPIDESLETLSAHLRNCRTAKLRYQHTHPSINEELFRRYGNELSFSIRADHVLVGPRVSFREALVVTSEPGQVEIEVDKDNLSLVVELVDSKSLNPCPIFFSRNVPQSTLDLLARMFPNIVITQDPVDPTRYTIL